jgi:hypothetical protein
MKKLLLAILLTIISTSAMAEWTYLTSSNSEDYYIDKSDIRKKGTRVKMWDMTDYKSAQTQINTDGASFLSSKSLTEYDCLEVKFTTLNITLFSGNLGKGEPVFNQQYDIKWTDIPPDTIVKRLWKTACNK